MTINLQKGQKIDLNKTDGTSLQQVSLGLGWDAASSGSSGGFLGGLFKSSPASIDLDASAILFDESGQKRDAVWFRDLKSKDGSIVHSGDNRTGSGDGDDETIKVDLTRVPDWVKSIVFTVNSFTGQGFGNVQNAYCRLVDQNSGQEVAKYTLSAQGNHTGLIIAKVYRHNGAWKMHAIGENVNGRTFEDMIPAIRNYL